MASGHVNRANRPNTWLLRPMLQARRIRSRPHMALLTHADRIEECSNSAAKRKTYARTEFFFSV
jgi:hypothetical protein